MSFKMPFSFYLANLCTKSNREKSHSFHENNNKKFKSSESGKIYFLNGRKIKSWQIFEITTGKINIAGFNM